MNFDFTSKPAATFMSAVSAGTEAQTEDRTRANGDLAGLLPLPQFMTIVPNENHGRVELHLRGYFNSPQENTRELAELYSLAERFPTLMIYINSGGGRVDLMLELFTVMDKFRHTVTVVCAEAASAGFLLWARGDIRVVQPHAELMAHRESYGFYGKTAQHEDNVVAKQKRFTRLYQEVTEGILSEDEFERSKYTEVTMSDEDMIERGCAISWEQFIEKDMEPVRHDVVIQRDGESYLLVNGMMVPISYESTGAIYDPMEVMYGIENKKNYMEDAISSLTESMMEGAQDSEEEETSEDDDSPVVSDVTHLRGLLRRRFGKNRWSVRADGSVRVRPYGPQVEVGNAEDYIGLTEEQVLAKLEEFF